jgi:hypothetical protein
MEADVQSLKLIYVLNMLYLHADNKSEVTFTPLMV